jgi:hypothetical protein
MRRSRLISGGRTLENSGPGPFCCLAVVLGAHLLFFLGAVQANGTLAIIRAVHTGDTTADDEQFAKALRP